MKRYFLLTLSLLFTILGVSQNTIEGKWKTISDEDGKEKVVVEIFKKNDGKYYGKVVDFIDPGVDQQQVCNKCPKDDPRYNEKLDGMEILKGLEASKNDRYAENGEILDIKKGKIYSCYVEMENDDTLKLRGYIGFSLLGRTQTWKRLK